MDSRTFEDLVARARAVARHAYAPVSSFAVGAALLGADGAVFVGCNVENASFGLTVCAERNALAAAVAAGARSFDAMVVYTPGVDPGYPCGACRQVLAEFAPALPIALAGDGDRVVHTTLAELLPHAFRFDYDR